MEIEVMNEKKIKRLWLFEFYDFELINTYINDRANQGEALEYIGSIFATYKKTMPGEYEYCVDYIENYDVDSEEFENYKKMWIDARWEYVDFYEGIIIFRCKKHNTSIQTAINLEKIRETIFFKVKKQGKSEWLQSAMWMLLAGLNIFLGAAEFKIVWVIIAAIQFLKVDSFFRYLNLRKSRKDGFIHHYDQSTVKIRIKKIFILRSIRKILAGILSILLLLILIFYYKNSFAAKCAIVLSVFIAGSMAYSSVKLHNKKRENKFNFESTKGKFLMISIGMIVAIAVIVSFVMIDQSKLKRDIIYDVPNIALECGDKMYHVNHDYGVWNYEYSNGISVGSEEVFRLPEREEIESIDIANDRTIDITVFTEPEKIEIRYWKKEDFNKLKSYDKGYKEIQVRNASFTALDEDVVYVVYAEWKKEFYDGVGYYLFTVERE